MVKLTKEMSMGVTCMFEANYLILHFSIILYTAER